MDKVSRRDAIKTFAGAGAFLGAQRYLPRISDPDEAASNHPQSDLSANDPLVVVVKNDELIGFRGLEEFVVKDSELISRLSRRFASRLGE